MVESKRNLKLVLAYDGTRYAGYQKQVGQTAPTIQATLETAILKISGEMVGVTGAGRTDAGVHARGQVVNFRTGSQLTVAQWQRALNANLPPDMLICDALEVETDFHARWDAKSKTYFYRIHDGSLRPVFNRSYVFFYKQRVLDEKIMQQAANLLIGAQDFGSFQAAGSPVKSTIRTVNFCRINRSDGEICLSINADGFLYHMVRNIVGTLILVGNGRISVAQFQQIIQAADRSLAGPTAPALGLCLEEVIY
ncbi:MAG: tRNA pseudouridine(38-40) synthase TruA [Bacillota bacterium]|jgi:tRNA pseudouridine38-40 synthase